MLWVIAWLTPEGNIRISGGARGPQDAVRDPQSDTVFAAFIGGDSLFIYKAYLDIGNDTVLWEKWKSYYMPGLTEVDIEVDPNHIYVATTSYIYNQYNAALNVIDRSTGVKRTFGVENSPYTNTKSISLTTNYPCIISPLFRRVFMSYWNDSTNTINIMRYNPTSDDTVIMTVTTVSSDRKTSLAFVCDTSTSTRKVLLAISSSTYTNVYESTDGGNTWSYTTGFSGYNSYAFAVSQGPYVGIAYEYSGSAYVRFSTDGGETFTPYLVMSNAYYPSGTILGDTLWIAFLTGNPPDTLYDTLYVGVRRGWIGAITFGNVDTLNSGIIVYTRWKPSIVGMANTDGRIVMVVWNRRYLLSGTRIAYNYDALSLSVDYPERKVYEEVIQKEIYDVMGRKYPYLPHRKGIYFVVGGGRIIKIIKR